MPGSPKPDPKALTYLTLRKAVGFVAIGLPFALAIPYLIVCRKFEPSISDYYFTAMRNLFVGSLCAIAMFQLACRGFDLKDEIAGMLSALFALGVAFFPTAPSETVRCPPLYPNLTKGVHYLSATLLFLTLAYFCLVLFKKTAFRGAETSQKLKRNRIYTMSGYVILASIAAIGTIKLLKLAHIIPADPTIGPLGTTFVFETTSLVAFGFAWLVKGETFFKDEPTPERVKGIAGGA